MTTAIWWIRRDLRLHDNEALAAALERADSVIPLFILDPALIAGENAGEKRLAFLYGGLRALDEALRARGSRLILREGEPVGALEAIFTATGAEAVFAEADFTPYARARDARAAAVVPLTLMGGLTVHPPDLVRKPDGDPYVVFTPFSKAWKALPPPGGGDLLPAPERLSTPGEIASLPLPEKPVLADSIPFAPGESEALRRLEAFTSGPIARYAEERDLPAVEGTSRLSPYLRFGMISARRAVAAAFEAMARAANRDERKGAETWLNELIWREFYISILHHFPRVLGGSFRQEMDAIPWRNDPAEFAAWCEGRTGYPIIDAGMRQLAAEGWMHNRVRMLVASFLVKDLLIDWRWGERYFMQQLVDGDPAANNGGWQWTAGTGTDAAPYFRVFNPALQAKKFDPEGAYIRRWLPELRDVPEAYIHEPATMPPEAQGASGCRIGIDTPAPMVDHHEARERVLIAYQWAKGGNA